MAYRIGNTVWVLLSRDPDAVPVKAEIIDVQDPQTILVNPLDTERLQLLSLSDIARTKTRLVNRLIRSHAGVDQ